MPPRGGPRSEAGRAVARLNALKHGFASRSPVIPGIEEDADWQRHHTGMKQSFNPVGYFEELLVRRLANIFWHLDRLTSYEVAAIMGQIDGTAEDLVIAANYLTGEPDQELVVPDERIVSEHRHRRLLPPAGALESIIRYGHDLHRQWVQTLHELEALQKRRQGEDAPLARVDVIVPAGPRPAPLAIAQKHE